MKRLHIMNRLILAALLSIMMSVLAACDGNHFFNADTGYYSNFMAEGEGREYEISGSAQVVDRLGLLYISAIEDADVNLTGELKSITGEIQIVYINQDNEETIVYDSSNGSQKGKLNLNTNINLKKGEGRLEFRGKDTAFKFDLLFADIDEDKFEYFSAEKKSKSDENEKDSESGDISGSNAEEDFKLLQEVSVIYTDKDDNCSVLDTSLDHNTKIKVLIEAGVSNADDKDSLSFSGFHLFYKTEDGDVVEVLNYKSDEFAMGGYEWQDGCVREIDLPKGVNNLIYNSYKGTNYETKLNIRVLEANNTNKLRQQLSVSSSGVLPDKTNALSISLDIDNGGVEILSTDSNEIKAVYDSEYYDVEIVNKNGKWNINISGKVSMMGKTDNVRLYIPDAECSLEGNVLNGNFSYALPENSANTINLTAENAGIDFTSKNQYRNSSILLIATNNDFLKYEPPVFPSFFTKTNNGFEYTNGSGKNKIAISLTGYTHVNFREAPASDLSYEPDSSGKIEIPVAVRSLASGAEICLGAIPDISNAKAIHYDLHSESGGSLFAGISPESSKGEKHFWVGSVESSTGNIVWDSSGAVGYSEEYAGDYYIYIRSRYGDCSNITGFIVVEYNQ